LTPSSRTRPLPGNQRPPAADKIEFKTNRPAMFGLNRSGTVDWKKLAEEAKEVVDKRGGPEGVKDEAQELMKVAEGDGSITDKLKAAAEAIKEPGAPTENERQPHDREREK
jgi:hypothetical protein